MKIIDELREGTELDQEITALQRRLKVMRAVNEIRITEVSDSKQVRTAGGVSSLRVSAPAKKFFYAGCVLGAFLISGAIALAGTITLASWLFETVSRWMR